MGMKKLFILLLALGLVLQFNFSETTKAAEDDVVVFKDENLAQAVYASIGKYENVTESDLLLLDKVEIWDDKPITSLSGLEYAKNLTSIIIVNSEVADLAPVSQLENLKNITLMGEGGSITDLTPLSNLTKLENLSLSNNKISDLTPLQGLTNLSFLDLNNNNITDLSPISKFSNLFGLYVMNNKITNIDLLADLPKLGDVGLSNNQLNLSKGSSAYQIIQKLLKSDVFVSLDPKEVFELKTKKVTNNSITVEWSIFDNTKQVGDEFTLYLNGQPVKTIKGSDVTEYTFEKLENGKTYEIKVEYIYRTSNSGGLESKILNVKAESAKTSEQVVVKPTVSGNNATISYENINAVQPNGQLVLDLKDHKGEQVNVQLTSEQIEMLQEGNVSIEINKGDASVKIPASILGDGKDVNLVIERLEKVEGALTPAYDFTIETDAGNISKFSVPVTLSFPVDKSAVKNTENVKVWYYNPTTKAWENVGGTYSNGVVTAETSHFSTYTVFEKETTSSQAESGTESNETTETNSDNELPNTATNMMNFLMFGLLLIFIATASFIYMNRRAKA